MSEPTATPPPPPPDGPPAEATGNAWERRGELGFVGGLLGAIKSFIVSPGEAFEETRKSGELASPLLFAIVISVVTAVIGQVWAMLIGTSMLTMMPAEFQEALPFFMASSGAGFMFSLIVIPIMTLVWIFLWGAIMHVLLMLVGGLDTSQTGFEGSIRVVAYSSVGNLAKLVPFIGGMVSLIWMIVLMVIGITKMHGTSEGKAVAAVLLPVILCCVCVGAAMMVGLGAVLSGLEG